MADLFQDSGAVMGLIMLASFVAAGVKLWMNHKEEQEKKNTKG